MAFETYATYDGLALGALVQRGEVSALELLETAIARAEAINPKINAIVYRGYDQARAAAAAFKPAGEPFAGVPLLLRTCSAIALACRPALPRRSSRR